MRDVSGQKSKSKQSSSRWPKVGPLGRDTGQVFSSLIYEDNNSPLKLVVVCTQEAIIILSDTEHADAGEIDITVAGQALFLKIDPTEMEADNQVNMSSPELAAAGIYKIPLIFEVDVTQIEAGFENDLLHIQLPRLALNNEPDVLRYLH